MKRNLKFIIITLMITLCLTSCSTSWSQELEQRNSEKLQIVTTIFPQYDFCRQIAGENADVTMLLKPGEESHSYEPTPADIRKLKSCDLFIYVGGENDDWVEEILESFGDEAPQTIRLVDLVETVAEEEEGAPDEGDHDEEEEGHSHGILGHHHSEPDEHVWTSPLNAMIITQALSDAMQELDPSHAKSYAANTAAYLEELQALDDAFHDMVSQAKRNVILVGDRFPFRYLADELGLEHYAAFSGCSANSEVSAKTIVYLTEMAEELEIPIIFNVDLSNGKIADAICEVTGAERLTLYSCHTLTQEELENGETYISMMQKNLETLRRALNE